MPNWVTEGIIVALLALSGALAKGWLDLRGMIRKNQQEEMAINTTARLELERLLMARIDQLQTHLRTNEEALGAVRVEVATLREENACLRIRVRDLEAENAALRAELKRICAERGVDGVLRGVTG